MSFIELIETVYCPVSRTIASANNFTLIYSTNETHLINDGWGCDQTPRLKYISSLTLCYELSEFTISNQTWTNERVYRYINVGCIVLYILYMLHMIIIITYNVYNICSTVQPVLMSYFTHITLCTVHMLTTCHLCICMFSVCICMFSVCICISYSGYRTLRHRSLRHWTLRHTL